MMTSVNVLSIPLMLVASSILGIIQSVCDIPVGASHDTYGKEFYIPYPEISVTGNTQSITMTLHLINPSSVKAILVDVDEPGQATVDSLTVSADDTNKKDLSNYQISSGTFVSSNVTILSSVDSFGVIVLMSYAMDGYTALPISSWGIKYTAVTYWLQGGGASQIVIVASQVSQVTVKIPAQDSRTISVLDTPNPAGPEELTENLNSGDAWQIQRHFDLTGTSIVSTAKIAVLCGNAGTSVGSSGKVGAFMEQLPRKSALGTQFVTFMTPSGDLSRIDLIRIMAMKDETVIYFSSAFQRVILNKGQYITRSANETTHFIHSNRPLTVVKFTYSDNNYPTMAVVMPTALFLKSKTVIFPKLSSSSQHLVILTRRKYKTCYDSLPDLTLDGSHDVDTVDITVLFYSYSKASVKAVVQCGDPNALVTVYLVATLTGMTFQSPLAYSLAQTTPECTPSPQSPGDGIDNDCDGLIDEDNCTLANNTAGGSSDCAGEHAGDPDVWGYRFSFLIPEHCPTITGVTTALYVTKLKDLQATIHVDTPLGTFHQTHTMPGGAKSVSISLPPSLKAVGSQIFTDITLQVTSDVEISITLVDSSDTSACQSLIALRLLPEDVLGMEYFVVTHCVLNECQFQVTAVHEGITQIKVLLRMGSGANQVTFQGNPYDKEEEICVNLSKGESFQLQSVERDLTGTHVVANKPIAVLSGGKQTTAKIGVYGDGVAEQMPPVNTWGHEFFFIQSPTKDYAVSCFSGCTDMLKIVSCVDHTEISVAGVLVALHRAGDTSLVEITNDAAFIYSNKPVLIVQVTVDAVSGQPDASMSLLTPVPQYGFEDILVKVASNMHISVAAENFQGQSLLISVDSDDHDMLKEVGFNASFVGVEGETDQIVSAKPQDAFPIGGQMYNVQARQTSMHPIAFLLRIINVPCVITQGNRGDGMDNDCDGLYDEEPCVKGALADSDGDGMMNEDCAPEPRGTYDTSLMNFISAIQASPSFFNTTTMLPDHDPNPLMSPTNPSLYHNHTFASYGHNITLQGSAPMQAHSTHARYNSNVYTVPTPSSYSETPYNFPATQVSAHDRHAIHPVDTPMFPNMVNATNHSVSSTSVPFPLNLFNVSRPPPSAPPETLATSTIPDTNVPEFPVFAPNLPLEATTTTWPGASSHIVTHSDQSSSYPGSVTPSTPSRTWSTSLATSVFGNYSTIWSCLDDPPTVVQSQSSDVSSILSSSSSLLSSSSPLKYTSSATSSAVETTFNIAATSSSATSSVVETTSNIAITSTSASQSTYTTTSATGVVAGSTSISSSASSIIPTPSLSSSVSSVVDTSVSTSATSPVSRELCSCNCPQNVITTSLEKTELNNVLKSIQNELYVDKTEVSKTKRKYISVQDHRPSAQAVGWLGVGMVAATFIGIVLFDMPVLDVSDQQQRPKHLQICHEKDCDLVGKN